MTSGQVPAHLCDKCEFNENSSSRAPNQGGNKGGCGGGGAATPGLHEFTTGILEQGLKSSCGKLRLLQS